MRITWINRCRLFGTVPAAYLVNTVEGFVKDTKEGRSMNQSQVDLDPMQTHVTRTRQPIKLKCLRQLQHFWRFSFLSTFLFLQWSLISPGFQNCAMILDFVLSKRVEPRLSQYFQKSQQNNYLLGLSKIVLLIQIFGSIGTTWELIRDMNSPAQPQSYQIRNPGDLNKQSEF
jgi:hypothetical protein